jgi:hypothetical protein
MSSLREVQSAADALPRSQQELLLEHLAAKLELASASHQKISAAARETVAWPDYEGRLRAIYGDKAMPSMVLSEHDTAVR